MIRTMILNFLFGGIIFTLIYLAANVYKNAALSAVLSLLPLSIFCAYIINGEEMIVKHSWNLIPVAIITIFCVLLLIILLKKTNVNKNILITIVLIVWIILQYLKIKYYNF